MKKIEDKKRLRIDVSVDCVAFGFDDGELNVLLVERKAEYTDITDFKLPGNLIYDYEDIDDAAYRILFESTGIKKMTLKQFKCFGSPERTKNIEDVKWLESTSKLHIGRVLTVAYLSLCKISQHLKFGSKYKSVIWCPVKNLPKMPFDHNLIVEESLKEIGLWFELEPSIAFELLPTKFTAAELRHLYEAIYSKKYEIRNFHKKIANMKYIIPLDEKQIGVSHRAARYYKFDRILYKKTRKSIL